jgi:hypothetical protein
MNVVDSVIDRANKLSRQCQEILEGQGAAAQGLALADLLSLWLAGHIIIEELSAGADARPQTDQLRELLLQEHIKHVRQLVPASEREILARTQAGSA